MDFLSRQRLSVTVERDLQNIHFKTRDMRVKINDKIYRLKEIESGADSLMELVEEPKFEDGDFLHSDWDDENITIICRKINGNHIFYHVSKANSIRLGFDKDKFWPNDGDFRPATEAEKQELLDALEKEGKRWNAEKLCVEDIPDELNFKEGDFLVKEYNDNDIYIFVLDRITECGTIYYHCHHSPTYDTTEIDSGYGIGRIGDYLHKSLRYADESEKNLLVAELAKKGKRWNAEKLCVEDIPQPKFKKGDKVRIKKGISSKTHGEDYPYFTEYLDEYIGRTMTVMGYVSNPIGTYVQLNEAKDGTHNFGFAEDWLEPYEGLKKGDLAIFWDEVKGYAIIRFYDRSNESEEYLRHKDNIGFNWANAIKFESKEQYERFIKGEI